MKERLGRREFLTGAVAAGVAVALPGAASAATARPRAEHIDLVVPGLDPAHDGLRVAQLSDLHVGPRTPVEVVRSAIEEANASRPDLVALTGDFLCIHPREVETMREQLGGLAAPTVAVLGNHDHWVDPRGAAGALREHGYEVLSNEWTTVTLRGVPLPVVGIDDLYTRHADVQRSTKGLPARRAPLVLAHAPRTADILRRLERSMVCLSGHTHGGQINIPIITPIFLHGIVHEPYVRGHFQLDRVHLYVNRGIGNSGLKVRLNCPPEVTIATLRAAPA
jgi:predicted MPP superfamily phosphohydrolase